MLVNNISPSDYQTITFVKRSLFIFPLLNPPLYVSGWLMHPDAIMESRLQVHAE